MLATRLPPGPTPLNPLAANLTGHVHRYTGVPEGGHQITIRLPDGSEKELPAGATTGDLAAAIGRKLAEAAVGGEVDGRLVDLDHPLTDGATVRIVTDDTDEGRFVIRHSTAHVLAQALIDIWPGTQIVIGPPIENGFDHHALFPNGITISEKELDHIESRMREIIAAAQAFERDVVSTDEALQLFEHNQFKTEIIENVETAQGVEDGFVSLYRNPPGPFFDLCRGPHVPTTKRLGHFKLQKVAGVYRRGDEKRPMLQRIYGTAWESKKALEEHLHMLEEAEKRDHRKIGQELDLFSFPDEIGSGLPVFHPKGGLIRKLMEDYSA